jgi:peptide-methionine (S)-S-oxide reductase
VHLSRWVVEIQLRTIIAIVAGVVGLAALVLGGFAASTTEPSARSASTQASTRESNMNTQTATFAAGCFWGVQSTFDAVPGVISTRVGYTGGISVDPTYQDVCTDTTQHAEAIEIKFDPAKVSYQKLLEVFFENHDPTTMDRQGPDEGSQYRSAIFYHSDEQKKLAEAEKARRDASGEYVGPIVTEIVEAKPFYGAEEYHQHYFENRGVHWSCHFGNGKKVAQ